MKIRKQPLGIWTLLLSVTTCLILIVGWSLAVSDIVQIPAQTSTIPTATFKPNSSSSKNLLLGLGDSLTRGEGDNQGLGYFGIVRNELKKANPKLAATNLAISGQNSIQLRKQLESENVKKLIGQAKWITLTIGGNDLNRGSGEGDRIDEAKAKTSKATYIANLESILQSIHRLNPDARLFMFGLYNPYGDLKNNEQSNRIIGEWNEAIRVITSRYPFTVVVPTYDLFQINPQKYLYTDHFHPNHTGYVRMSTRLLQVIHDSKATKELKPS